MYTKKMFKEYDGMFYVGNIIDVDGDGWVTEEQLELLLLEINNGAEVNESVLFVPFTNNENDSVNFIHLN